jgi:DNA-binding XRE family transcriptional regulator
METLIYQRWGRRIRECRSGLYRQAELARIVGVSKGTMSKYESGRLHVPDRVKLRICGALHKSPDEIFPWPIDVPPFPA